MVETIVGWYLHDKPIVGRHLQGDKCYLEKPQKRTQVSVGICRTNHVLVGIYRGKPGKKHENKHNFVGWFHDFPQRSLDSLQALRPRAAAGGPSSGGAVARGAALAGGRRRKTGQPGAPVQLDPAGAFGFFDFLDFCRTFWVTSLRREAEIGIFVPEFRFGLFRGFGWISCPVMEPQGGLWAGGRVAIPG